MASLSAIKDSALSLIESGITLPAAQDMLPIAERLWRAGQVQAVENVEPTYLRNEVTWKNCRVVNRYIFRLAMLILLLS